MPRWFQDAKRVRTRLCVFLKLSGVMSTTSCWSEQVTKSTRNPGGRKSTSLLDERSGKVTLQKDVQGGKKQIAVKDGEENVLDSPLAKEERCCQFISQFIVLNYDLKSRNQEY